jgi:hypothetical protein
MKKSELRQLIKEEITKTLTENSYELNELEESIENAIKTYIDDESVLEDIAYMLLNFHNLINREYLNEAKTAFINGKATEYEKDEDLNKFKDNSDVKSITTAAGKKIKESTIALEGRKKKEVKTDDEDTDTEVEDEWEKPEQDEDGDKDKEPSKKELASMKKDSVATVASKLQKLVKQMKIKADEYKEAKSKNDTKKISSIVDELKSLTTEKKKLEQQLS